MSVFDDLRRANPDVDLGEFWSVGYRFIRGRRRGSCPRVDCHIGKRRFRSRVIMEGLNDPFEEGRSDGLMLEHACGARYVSFRR